MPGRPRLPLLLLAVATSGCAIGVPVATDGPSSDATPPPSSSASAGATTSPGATGSPSSPAETTPSPSASAAAGSLDLEVTGCEGGVLLDWSASDDPAFHHYTALRSPVRQIEPDYPPIAPAVDWGDTYATDRFVTTAVDASIIPSATTWFYRVMAYDVTGAVVGASPVRSARMADVADLGQLVVAPGVDGATLIEWHAYTGFSRCFSSYRVLFRLEGGASTVLTVVSDQSVASVETQALHGGATYQLSVRAVRDTTLGTLIVGETEVASYTVP